MKYARQLSRLAWLIILLATLNAGISAEEFMLGADISWIPEQEAKGRKFQDGAQAKDIFTIVKEHQFNWIRLRLFNNPRATTNGYSVQGFCDLDNTRKMAKRIQQAGLKFLLDFHYSDTWADPGHQYKPAAWKELPMDQLTKAVREYTRDTIRSLAAAGTPPQMVQVGNEISNGMLWPDGKITRFDQLAELFKAGAAGVREADPKIKVMLHLALGGDNAKSRWFLDQARQRGVEFDILGQSYYPKWHGTPNDLRTNLTDLAGRYPWPIIVVEYSEHKREVNSIVQALPNGKGQGTFIWEPTEWGEALFKKDGQALPSLELYPELARSFKTTPRTR
ncbi:MAG: glycosyl hydrolase 53 family protein [Verrucomicrobiota bacterium]